MRHFEKLQQSCCDSNLANDKYMRNLISLMASQSSESPCCKGYIFKTSPIKKLCLLYKDDVGSSSK